jgi:hypothetical protein
MVVDSVQKAAEAARAAATRSAGGVTPPRRATSAPFVPPIVTLSPSELPDYRPPFKAGGVRADRQGNVWIQTTAPRAPSGGLLVDVIDRKGELVDRIELPVGRTLVGVGDGVVYLAARESAGTHLERARVR